MKQNNIESKKSGKPESRTDMERLLSMKDDEIDYSDIPKTSPEFWEQLQSMVSISITMLDNSGIHVEIPGGLESFGDMRFNPNIDLVSPLLRV